MFRFPNSVSRCPRHCAIPILALYVSLVLGALNAHDGIRDHLHEFGDDDMSLALQVPLDVTPIEGGG